MKQLQYEGDEALRKSNGDVVQDYYALARRFGGEKSLGQRLLAMDRVARTYYRSTYDSELVWDMVRSPMTIEQMETLAQDASPLFFGEHPMTEEAILPTGYFEMLGLDPENERDVAIAQQIAKQERYGSKEKHGGVKGLYGAALKIGDKMVSEAISVAQFAKMPTFWLDEMRGITEGMVTGWEQGRLQAEAKKLKDENAEETASKVMGALEGAAKESQLMSMGIPYLQEHDEIEAERAATMQAVEDAMNDPMVWDRAMHRSADEMSAYMMDLTASKNPEATPYIIEVQQWIQESLNDAEGNPIHKGYGLALDADGHWDGQWDKALQEKMEDGVQATMDFQADIIRVTKRKDLRPTGMWEKYDPIKEEWVSDGEMLAAANEYMEIEKERRKNQLKNPGRAAAEDLIPFPKTTQELKLFMRDWSGKGPITIFTDLILQDAQAVMMLPEAIGSYADLYVRKREDPEWTAAYSDWLAYHNEVAEARAEEDAADPMNRAISSDDPEVQLMSVDTFAYYKGADDFDEMDETEQELWLKVVNREQALIDEWFQMNLIGDAMVMSGQWTLEEMKSYRETHLKTTVLTNMGAEIVGSMLIPVAKGIHYKAFTHVARGSRNAVGASKAVRKYNRAVFEAMEKGLDDEAVVILGGGNDARAFVRDMRKFYNGDYTGTHPDVVSLTDDFFDAVLSGDEATIESLLPQYMKNQRTRAGVTPEMARASAIDAMKKDIRETQAAVEAARQEATRVNRSVGGRSSGVKSKAEARKRQLKQKLDDDMSRVDEIVEQEIEQSIVDERTKRAAAINERLDQNHETQWKAERTRELRDDNARAAWLRRQLDSPDDAIAAGAAAPATEKVVEGTEAVMEESVAPAAATGAERGGLVREVADHVAAKENQKGRNKLASIKGKDAEGKETGLVSGLQRPTRKMKKEGYDDGFLVSAKKAHGDEPWTPENRKALARGIGLAEDALDDAPLIEGKLWVSAREAAPKTAPVASVVEETPALSGLAQTAQDAYNAEAAATRGIVDVDGPKWEEDMAYWTGIEKKGQWNSWSQTRDQESFLSAARTLAEQAGDDHLFTAAVKMREEYAAFLKYSEMGGIGGKEFVEAAPEWSKSPRRMAAELARRAKEARKPELNTAPGVPQPPKHEFAARTNSVLFELYDTQSDGARRTLLEQRWMDRRDGWKTAGVLQPGQNMPFADVRVGIKAIDDVDANVIRVTLKPGKKWDDSAKTQLRDMLDLSEETEIVFSNSDLSVGPGVRSATIRVPGRTIDPTAPPKRRVSAATVITPDDSGMMPPPEHTVGMVADETIVKEVIDLDDLSVQSADQFQQVLADLQAKAASYGVTDSLVLDLIQGKISVEEFFNAIRQAAVKRANELVPGEAPKPTTASAGTLRVDERAVSISDTMAQAGAKPPRANKKFGGSGRDPVADREAEISKYEDMVERIPDDDPHKAFFNDSLGAKSFLQAETPAEMYNAYAAEVEARIGRTAAKSAARRGRGHRTKHYRYDEVDDAYIKKAVNDGEKGITDYLSFPGEGTFKATRKKIGQILGDLKDPEVRADVRRMLTSKDPADSIQAVSQKYATKWFVEGKVKKSATGHVVADDTGKLRLGQDASTQNLNALMGGSGMLRKLGLKADDVIAYIRTSLENGNKYAPQLEKVAGIDTLQIVGQGGKPGDIALWEWLRTLEEVEGSAHPLVKALKNTGQLKRLQQHASERLRSAKAELKRLGVDVNTGERILPIHEWEDKSLKNALNELTSEEAESTFIEALEMHGDDLKGFESLDKAWEVFAEDVADGMAGEIGEIVREGRSAIRALIDEPMESLSERRIPQAEKLERFVKLVNTKTRKYVEDVIETRRAAAAEAKQGVKGYQVTDADVGAINAQAQALEAQIIRELKARGRKKTVIKDPKPKTKAVAGADAVEDMTDALEGALDILTDEGTKVTVEDAYKTISITRKKAVDPGAKAVAQKQAPRVAAEKPKQPPPPKVADEPTKKDVAAAKKYADELNEIAERALGTPEQEAARMAADKARVLAIRLERLEDRLTKVRDEAEVNRKLLQDQKRTELQAEYDKAIQEIDAQLFAEQAAIRGEGAAATAARDEAIAKAKALKKEMANMFAARQRSHGDIFGATPGWKLKSTNLMQDMYAEGKNLYPYLTYKHGRRAHLAMSRLRQQMLEMPEGRAKDAMTALVANFSRRVIGDLTYDMPHFAEHVKHWATMVARDCGDPETLWALGYKDAADAGHYFAKYASLLDADDLNAVRLFEQKMTEFVDAVYDPDAFESSIAKQMAGEGGRPAQSPQMMTTQAPHGTEEGATITLANGKKVTAGKRLGEITVDGKPGEIVPGPIYEHRSLKLNTGPHRKVREAADIDKLYKDAPDTVVKPTAKWGWRNRYARARNYSRYVNGKLQLAGTIRRIWDVGVGTPRLFLKHGIVDPLKVLIMEPGAYKPMEKWKFNKLYDRIAESSPSAAGYIDHVMNRVEMSLVHYLDDVGFDYQHTLQPLYDAKGNMIKGRRAELMADFRRWVDDPVFQAYARDGRQGVIDWLNTAEGESFIKRSGVRNKTEQMFEENPNTPKPADEAAWMQHDKAVFVDEIIDTGYQSMEEFIPQAFDELKRVARGEVKRRDIESHMMKKLKEINRDSVVENPWLSQKDIVGKRWNALTFPAKATKHAMYANRLARRITFRHIFNDVFEDMVKEMEDAGMDIDYDVVSRTAAEIAEERTYQVNFDLSQAWQVEYKYRFAAFFMTKTRLWHTWLLNVGVKMPGVSGAAGTGLHALEEYNRKKNPNMNEWEAYDIELPWFDTGWLNSVAGTVGSVASAALGVVGLGDIPGEAFQIVGHGPEEGGNKLRIRPAPWMWLSEHAQESPYGMLAERTMGKAFNALPFRDLPLPEDEWGPTGMPFINQLNYTVLPNRIVPLIESFYEMAIASTKWDDPAEFQEWLTTLPEDVRSKYYEQAGIYKQISAAQNGGVPAIDDTLAMQQAFVGAFLHEVRAIGIPPSTLVVSGIDRELEAAREGFYDAADKMAYLKEHPEVAYGFGIKDTDPWTRSKIDDGMKKYIARRDKLDADVVLAYNAGNLTSQYASIMRQYNIDIDNLKESNPEFDEYINRYTREDKFLGYLGAMIPWADPSITAARLDGPTSDESSEFRRQKMDELIADLATQGINYEEEKNQPWIRSLVRSKVDEAVDQFNRHSSPFGVPSDVKQGIPIIERAVGLDAAKAYKAARLSEVKMAKWGGGLDSSTGKPSKSAPLMSGLSLQEKNAMGYTSSRRAEQFWQGYLGALYTAKRYCKENGISPSSKQAKTIMQNIYNRYQRYADEEPGGSAFKEEWEFSKLPFHERLRKLGFGDKAQADNLYTSPKAMEGWSEFFYILDDMHAELDRTPNPSNKKKPGVGMGSGTGMKVTQKYLPELAALYAANPDWAADFNKFFSLKKFGFKAPLESGEDDPLWFKPGSRTFDETDYGAEENPDDIIYFLD